MRARMNSGIVATLATVGVLAAFASSVLAQGNTGTASSRQSTVQVQNDRKVPVTVFVERGPFDLRIGVVGPMQTTTLRLPPWVASDGEAIRIFVQPEGGEDLESQELIVHRDVQLSVLVPASGYPWSMQPAAARMTAVLTPDELSATTLTVENHRSVEVTIYAEQGEFDVRLGKVAAGEITTLNLPKWLVNDHQAIEIFAHPARGEDLESTRIDLRKGEHLGLRIPAQ